ncbi:2-succinyl-6-hydroxy-2,4-cyclohexadiene-1-carboxylate synthase [mine drainage metagenome]|uniref:2-succinyl-6-hydroxy-2, 4-cyclohexadiene-1-carboxylate synthase n=1 Tax=mine drainage metagenome TaxID=410659 RepID=A0A1J5T5N1_9ZZZZ
MDAPYLMPLPGGRLDVQWLAPQRPGAPTLVFLHEGLGSIRQWRDFPARLVAASGCGGVVYSRLGYGRSDPLTLPRPFDYLQQEARTALPALLARLEIARPLLVGHSDGGSIALLSAALAPPPGLAAVIAMAPHIFVEDITLDGIRQAHAAYHAAKPGGLHAGLAKYHGDKTADTFAAWAETWQRPEFRAWNVAAEMQRITVPVLALQGRQDEYATLRQIDGIVERLPPGLGRAVVIEDCGHSPHLQHPDQVLAALLPFIAGLGTAPD